MRSLNEYVDNANSNSTVDCLDGGFVRLVDYMGGDLSSVNAARISFNKHKFEMDDKDAKLIKYLGEHGHTSPMRHSVFTLHFKAPLFIRAQAIKHTVGSDYTFKDVSSNEISRRYVTAETPDFHFPKEFRLQSTDNKQASGSEILLGAEHEAALSSYNLAMATAYNSYLDLIERGVAREQARMVLPTAIYTEWYVTASLQWCTHFYGLRTGSGAQAEIKEYANAIKSLVYNVAPKSWDALTGETSNG